MRTEEGEALSRSNYAFFFYQLRVLWTYNAGVSYDFRDLEL